jgi:hypothetical protein
MAADEDRSDLAPLDVRWGINSLAAFINRTPRQTYHMVTTGALPAKQVGERWSWSPSKVRAHVLGDA